MPDAQYSHNIDQLNYESTASQHARVREHLLSGRALTPLEALRLYGCMRLAAIVLRLRKNEGLNIVCEMVSDSTAEGAKQWARYSLGHAADQDPATVRAGLPPIKLGQVGQPVPDGLNPVAALVLKALPGVSEPCPILRELPFKVVGQAKLEGA